MGLEFVFPKQIFKQTYFLGGIYYSEADMAYALNSTKIPGGNYGLSGMYSMNGRLMYIGFGCGLDKEIRLGRKFMMGFSSSICLGKYIMDENLIDTITNNSRERINPLFETITIIDLPPKVYNKFNCRLKSKINFSYFIFRDFAFKLGLIYNFGLPNKAFERSFYIYDSQDLNVPISYEKAVFSNSSAEFVVGFSLGF